MMDCLLSKNDTTFDIESGAYNNLYRRLTNYDGFYFGDLVAIENGKAVPVKAGDGDKPLILFVSYVVQNLKDKT